jgi:uncharacterized cupin superfamily protein
VAGSKGFVNKAKSGTRALTARQGQQAARGRIERQRPPAQGSRPRSTEPGTRRRKPMIHVEHDPSAERLNALGVFNWPIWTKEVSSFPWSYETIEWCYLLDGDVEVVPDGGVGVRIARGDLVRFPAGLSCVWNVKRPVRKHYRFVEE